MSGAMSHSKIRSNPEVSNAILKGLASGKPNVVSSQEWADIKKIALSQVRTSGNPRATLNTIKASLAMGNKVAAGALSEKIDDFVSGRLSEAVSKRQETLKNEPRVSTWTGGRYGNTT
jgi:hypothetical protein